MLEDRSFIIQLLRYQRTLRYHHPPPKVCSAKILKQIDLMQEIHLCNYKTLKPLPQLLKDFSKTHHFINKRIRFLIKDFKRLRLGKAKK